MATGKELALEGLSEVNVGDQQALYRKARTPQVRTDGISSVTVVQALTKNAVVHGYSLGVRADHADAALLGNVAQVRLQKFADNTVTFVADLGTPRTVSAIGVANGPPTAMKIVSVSMWNGVQFTLPIYESDPVATAFFDSEVSTARLMVVMKTTATIDQIAANVWVQLPDAPSDLVLTIDGGSPVWRFPGPVQAGSTPQSTPWNNSAEGSIDLKPALAALTGDPTDETRHEYQLTLTARIPGLLDLTLPEPGGPNIAISYLHRVDLGPDGKRDIQFDAEGLVTLPLTLASWTNLIEATTLTVAAALPAERAVPPVGPPIATLLGGGANAGGVAELVLDIDHSACVQPPAGTSLAELTAIRLPLRADAGGAEVRVVLLTPGDEPGAPVAGASSKSVTLDAPGPDDDPDPWLTFAFARPVTIKEATPPWVQVVVVRGTVHWTLGSFAATANLVRRGPTAGPWQELPRLLGDDATIGGRVRLVGHALKEKPIAPLTFSIVGASAAVRDVPATPNAKGVPATLTAAPSFAPQGAAGHPTMDLLVVSSVAGTVTVRDIDVTASK